MKTIVKSLISFYMCTFVVATSAYAVEKTGGDFQELLQEMNEEISQARVKIEALDAERVKLKDNNPQESLGKRKEALKELESSVEAMNNTDDEQERRAYSKDVEAKIVKVSETSADYLEMMKDDLLSQDKQMKLMEDVLSGVIYKLDKLHEISNEEKTTAQSGEELKKNKEKIKNMAKIDQNPGFSKNKLM